RSCVGGVGFLLALKFQTNQLLRFVTSNRSASEQCECGLYGLNSPLLSAQGFVAIPKAASLQACDWNTQFTVTELPWIALIERGNCTFAEKIKVAARRGATAAVIYNAPEQNEEALMPV
uniref:PA domain-containing protein n=1 Tax=Meleagris gallopavo TaxID=9103 RepID=A0A803YKQ9_MELGA